MAKSPKMDPPELFIHLGGVLDTASAAVYPDTTQLHAVAPVEDLTPHPGG